MPAYLILCTLGDLLGTWVSLGTSILEHGREIPEGDFGKRIWGSCLYVLGGKWEEEW